MSKRPVPGSVRCLALLFVTVAGCGVPPGPVGPVEGFRLSYNSKGVLEASSRDTLKRVVDSAASATDVVIMSHGWWNNASTAECRYQAMVDGLRKNRPSSVSEQSVRAVFVGIYWPSAVFPIEESDCQATASPRDETLEASERSPDLASMRSWVVSAFPDSSESDRSRVADILNRSAADDGLTEAESTELVSTLLRLRNNSTPPLSDPEGPVDDPFAGDAKQVAARWIKAETEVTENERFRPTKWLSFANAFTFWAMKERAGVVGSQGVFDLVRALQPLRKNGVRLHLIGHSFGAKLVSAAITGHGERGEPNTVDSMVLLQGALSHFGFATAEEITAAGVQTTRAGKYADIARRNLVSKLFVATYSDHDDKNRYYYPAAVRLSGDFLEADRVSKYGSLGADGIQGMAAEERTYKANHAASLALTTGRRFSVDASAVVSGHSDVVNDEVCKLLWAVFEAAVR